MRALAHEHLDVKVSHWVYTYGNVRHIPVAYHHCKGTNLKHPAPNTMHIFRTFICLHITLIGVIYEFSSALGVNDTLASGWSHTSELYFHIANNADLNHCLLNAVCRFVSDWVYSGVFRDVYKEFMIQVNEDYLSYRGEHARLFPF